MDGDAARGGALGRAGLVLLALAACPSPALAWDWSLGTQHAFVARALPEVVESALLRQPAGSDAAVSRAAYRLSAFGRLRGRPVPRLGLQLGLDSGLLELDADGPYPSAEVVGALARESLLLGATHLEAELGSDGEVLVRVGKLLGPIASPAIFDAYALGAVIDVDPSFGDPDAAWRVHLSAVLPDPSFTARGKDSPLFAAELGWVFGRAGALHLVGALFVDGGDGLAPLLAEAAYRARLTAIAVDVNRRRLPAELKRAITDWLVESGGGGLGFDVSTRGRVGWLGLRGDARGPGWSLRGTALVQTGRIATVLRANALLDARLAALEDRFPRAGREVRGRIPDQIDVAIRSLAWFGELVAELEPSETLRLGGFLVLSSGDSGFSGADPEARSVDDRSFLSLAPNLGHTRLFFDGGVGATLTAPTAASLSPDGSGLVALGAVARWAPHERVDLEAVLAGFGALGGASFEDQLAGVEARFTPYGLELDLGARWRPAELLELRLDAAVLAPGRYYGPEVPLAWQLLSGIVIWLDGRS